MQHDEVFSPESIDEQIEQWASLSSSEVVPPEFEVIPRLSSLYQADQQSTERVWQRLAQHLTKHDANVQSTSKLSAAFPSRPEAERPPRQRVSYLSKHTGSSWLTQVAAILVAALLVGSLLGVLSLMHTNHTTHIASMLLATPPGLYFNRLDDVSRLNAQTRKVIWHTHLAGQSRIAGKLVLIGDTVYITSGGTLWALDASNGAMRWSRSFYGSGLSLAMDKGLLYIDVFFGKMSLYTVNPNDGAITATYTPPQGGWNTPTVVDGVLYYTVGPRLYAVQLSDEKLLWQQQVDTHSLIEGLSVQNDIVYAQVMGGLDISSPGPVGLIVAFDARSGHKLWQSPADPRGVRIVSITDKMLYVATFNALLAYDVHIHKLLWQQPFNAGQMLLASGMLYLGNYTSGTDHAGFAALNATTGKLVWQKTNDSGGGALLADVHDGIVYGTFWTGQGVGTIYALNASTGSQLWTMPTGATSAAYWGGMAVA